MRCVACGAEMRLVGVSLTDTPMAGFERHTLKCSTCSHVSRRLVLAEKFRSRQVAAQERAARARTSTWAEAVEKLRRKQAALKEQAEVASRTQPDEPVLAPAAPSGRPTKPAPLNSPTASRWSRRDL
jgi:hypothetical protein